jgi:hypothetical protein
VQITGDNQTIMKIRPDDPRKLPLAFAAGEELAGKGENHYVDEMGNAIGKRDLAKAMKGGKKVVRLKLKARYRSDPPDAPLREITVLAVVDGNMLPEELGRTLHKMARSLYSGR